MSTSTERLDAMERATRETCEQVIAAYKVCALWSSSGYPSDDTPLDENYDVDDIAPETRETMATECIDFLELCWSDEVNLDLSPIEPAQIGHDFWLTRNGHGAGFWDRGLGALGDDLTKWAKTFGSADLYVGDDGLIYQMG